jgi:hypothetical protein
MRLGTLLTAATLAASAESVHSQGEDISDSERLDVVYGPRPIQAPGALASWL